MAITAAKSPMRGAREGGEQLLHMGTVLDRDRAQVSVRGKQHIHFFFFFTLIRKMHFKVKKIFSVDESAQYQRKHSFIDVNDPSLKSVPIITY